MRDILFWPGWGYEKEVMHPLARVLAERNPGYWRVHFLDPDDDIADGAAGLLVSPAGPVAVGWSMGGLAAMRWAGENPGCRTVCLLASSPCFVGQPDWPGILMERDFADLKEGLLTDRNKAMRRFTTELAAGRYAVMKTLIRFLSTKPLPVLVAGLGQLEKTDLRSLLSALIDRSHILLGEKDTLIPVEIGAALQYRYPALDLRYVDGGHAFFLSHSHQTADFIENAAHVGET